MTVVFSLSGKLFENKKLLANYLVYFEQLAKKQQVGLVIGGGKRARKYIKEIKSKGANDTIQHMLGVIATRENAQKVCDKLKSACPRPALDFEDALEMSLIYPIVVMGGTIPYVTTDNSAVILGALFNAKKVINLTNVDYLYTKDPKKYKNVKKITKMNKKKFLDLVLKQDKRRPGENFVIDSIAAFILTKTNSALYIINGNNLNEVKKAVSGKKFKGTVVK